MSETTGSPMAGAGAPWRDRREGAFDRRPRPIDRRIGRDDTSRSADLPRPIVEAPADPPVLRRDAVYRRACAAADIIAAVSGVTALISLSSGNTIKPGAAALVLAVVPLSLVLGLYDDDLYRLRKSTLQEVPRLIIVACGFVALAAFGSGFAFGGALEKPLALATAATVALSLTLFRGLTRRVLRATLPPERCLIVADTQTGEWVTHKLTSSRHVSATVVGRVDTDPRASSREGVLGTVDLLGLILVEHEIDRVVVAFSGAPDQRQLEVIRLVKAMGVKVTILPQLFEVVGSAVRFDEVDGMTLLGVPHFGLSRSSRLVKRTFDLVGSVCLICLSSPLWVVIAVSIKLSSPGPIYFRQQRTGTGAHDFEIIKFRTMVRDAEEQKAGLGREAGGSGLFKLTDDPRVTRVGRVLRKTSLDELPQLINVVKGEMSLVGPRPLIPLEDEKIGGMQRRRLELAPGVTGPWQILGATRVPLEEMVKIDYLYGANWSLWTDIQILLRTGLYVMGRQNV